MLWKCAIKNGTNIDELLQAGTSGHKRVWTMLRRIRVLEESRILANEAREWTIEGQKEKDYKERISEIVERIRDRRFHGAGGLWKVVREKCWKKDVYCPKKM